MSCKRLSQSNDPVNDSRKRFLVCLFYVYLIFSFYFLHKVSFLSVPILLHRQTFHCFDVLCPLDSLSLSLRISLFLTFSSFLLLPGDFSSLSIFLCSSCLCEFCRPFSNSFQCVRDTRRSMCSRRHLTVPSICHLSPYLMLNVERTVDPSLDST